MVRIDNLIFRIGYWIALMFRPFHRSIPYFWYSFKRGVVTSFYKNKLRYIGRGSMLSPNMWIVNPQNISIGQNTTITSHVVLETNKIPDSVALLEIGNEVSIGEYSHITCCSHIIIGDGVLFGRFVLVTDNAHGNSSLEERNIRPVARSLASKGPVVIGCNVWIGDKATILPNVTIGDGCIVAANSVVTKSVPPYSVVAGIPAKIVKILK